MQLLSMNWRIVVYRLVLRWRAIMRRLVVNWRRNFCMAWQGAVRTWRSKQRGRRRRRRR
jgi:hypothetical protein